VGWISLIVLAVILLRTIAKGGDWFDFLNSEALFGNRWKSFEFSAFFILLCLVMFGGAACLLIMAMKPEPTLSTAYQSNTVVSSAHHVHKSQARTGKAHKKAAQ